jgi:hypothetical protein
MVNALSARMDFNNLVEMSISLGGMSSSARIEALGHGVLIWFPGQAVVGRGISLVKNPPCGPHPEVSRGRVTWRGYCDKCLAGAAWREARSGATLSIERDGRLWMVTFIGAQPRGRYKNIESAYALMFVRNAVAWDRSIIIVQMVTPHRVVRRLEEDTDITRIWLEILRQANR